MAAHDAHRIDWRSWVLWGGFALICAAAVATVLLPELADEGPPKAQGRPAATEP